ncbi:hypothetical protein [Brevibacillus sp. SYSU BS000544]|uniref:hypothetical protein n=1 Tax=Brevibacillus sp. SYSU BS000544 TaxID=3416443 RepID=UPI003CE49510
MKKNGLAAYFLIILLFTFAVWFGIQLGQDDKTLVVDNDKALVELFLHEKGYEIISSKGLVETYVLTHELVQTLPYKRTWHLPGNNPAALYGKQIDVYHHTVKNHPLDLFTCCKMKPSGKTNTFVFVSEHQIVGGTSYPVTPEPLMGGSWSLDGTSQ